MGAGHRNAIRGKSIAIDEGLAVCSREHPSFWLVVLFCLLALFTARTAWGDEIPIPSGPSTPPASPLTISGWQTFDEAWTSLKAELTASDEDSARLLTLLQNLQIEADALRSSLLESNRLLQLSDQALEVERQRTEDAIDALEAAQVSSRRWRAVAGLCGSIAAVSMLALIF